MHERFILLTKFVIVSEDRFDELCELLFLGVHQGFLWFFSCGKFIFKIFR